MFTFEDQSVSDAFFGENDIIGIFAETSIVKTTETEDGYVEKSTPINFLGYFDDIRIAKKEVLEYPSKFDYHGNSTGYWLYAKNSGQIRKFYTFYNSLNPMIMNRSWNRMKTGASGAPTNPDFYKIKKIPFDIDPILPSRWSGYPSTDEELDWTKRFRDELLLELEEWGFDDPILAMSGNGSYCIANVDYHMEDFRYIKRFVTYLSDLKRFDKFRMHAHLDKNVTPRQMCKFFGTRTKKGKQVKDQGRVWRVSHIEHLGSLIPAGIDVIENLRLNFPDQDSFIYSGDDWNLDEWLFKHPEVVIIGEPLSYGDGSYRYILEMCPFCGRRSTGEIYLLWTPESDNYYPKFNCPHPGCDSLRFKQFKQMIERGHYDEI